LPPSVLAPRRLANEGPNATAALLEALKDNHERCHVFFNHKSFHNHAAHHLLAIWALGASGPLIDAAYHQTHLDHQRNAFKSPIVITHDNFNDFLGDENNYNAYLTYFHEVVVEKGIAGTIEEYIFSEKYNVDPVREAKGQKQAEMLNRFLEILIHPIIHTGYGAEFGLLGMIAEGLAQTSVHPAGATVLVTQLLYRSKDTSATPRPKVHAFTILSRMLKDPRFSNKILDKVEYAQMLETHGDAIVEYGSQWVVDIKGPKDLEYYLEQIAWASTMIYGIGSWKETEDYAADFFTMHSVTSALFLPSICAYITLEHQSQLLRAHFLAMITWWLVRGRPAFPITRFLSSPTAPNQPAPVGPQPTPASEAIPSPSSAYAVTPNPWLPLIQTTLVHPNEHLCKLQRALAHFSELYGSRTKGYFVGTDLPEAEELDGSLFIRVALLTANRLGWVREGVDNSGVWNYQEFEKERK